MIGAALEALVRREMERWDVPAMVVGVRAGEREDVRAFGAAEPDSRFRIASITKPFTAMTAVSLARESLLDLDAPLREGVTARQALTHTSGLPCEHGDLTRFGDGDDALPTLVAELPGPRWPPLWAYCNAGYWLTGHACGGAVGGTYEDAVRQRVLEPLALADTGFAVEPTLAGREPYGDTPTRYPRARRASGGLVSTAPDLLVFAAHHLGDDPVARAMREPAAAALGSAWGLGWRVTHAGAAAGHPGGWGGFRSQLVVVPRESFALVALASSGSAVPAIRAVVDHALDELAGLPRELPETTTLPADALDVHAGVYRTDSGDETTVVPDDGALRLDSPPHPPERGLPVSAREFVVVDGESAGDRFDFPAPGLARFGPFAERVE